MKKEFKRPQKHNVEYEEFTESGYNESTNRNNQNRNYLRESNSSKNFINVTSESIPKNPEILMQSGIPFAVHFTPMSFFENQQEIKTLSFGNKDLPRCKNKPCSSYINPYVKWENNNSTWTCNLCSKINTTDDHFLDLQQKITMGTYEFFTNSNYTSRPPINPTYVFILDTSLKSIQSGLFISIIESLKSIFQNDLFQNLERTKFALITYDRNINFFSFNGKQFEMLCTSYENEQNFLPAPLLVYVDENKNQFLKLLDHLQNYCESHYFVNNRAVANSKQTIKAIEAGCLLLEKSGGKLIVLNTSADWIKSHHFIMKNSEEKTDNPLIIKDFEDYLKILGRKLNSYMISCDLFQIQLGNEKTNFLTLNEISNLTNGNTFYYENFNLERDFKSLFNMFTRIITKPTGWEAMCKIRLSKGFKIKDHLTPILTNNLDLMIMPTVDCDQTYTITVEPGCETKFSEDPMVYLQIGMLYTNIDGSRRIRVFNYAIKLVDTIADYFEEIDSESVMCLISKEMINSIYSNRAFEPSMSIIQKYNYGRFMHNIKLIFQKFNNEKKNDQNLSHIPKYFLGIQKCKLFYKNQRNEFVDFFNYLRLKLLKMQSFDLRCYIYTDIYDLNNIFSDDFESPNLISADIENLEKGGIFLIDNGFSLIIYFSKDKDNQNKYFNLLFKNTKYTEIINEDEIFEIEFYDEASKLLAQRLKLIIERVRSSKILFQNLKFIFDDNIKEKVY